MKTKLCPLLLSLLCSGKQSSAETTNLPNSQGQSQRNHQQQQMLRTSDLILEKQDLPSDREWVTLDESGMEFQPAPASDNPKLEKAQRHLTSSAYEFQSNQFGGEASVDGAETFYDEYAQAWRVLGFYVDCDACTSYQYEYGNCYEYRGGGNTGNNTDDYGCQRYLLWAAYVDLGYEGGGASEYQYYDRRSNKWYDTACSKNNRCVKMDCHLPNTEWSLLGYFKEPNYDTWMEQLFKYEGDCVWTDEEKEFMQQRHNNWPTQCTKAERTDTFGKSLYYDTRPQKEGSMSIGLYKDPWCTKKYNNIVGSSVEGVVYGSCENCGEDGSSLVEELDTWNMAFDVFKQCQPCKTYDLTSIVAGANYERNATGDRYSFENNAEYGFVCSSDAHYPVNQCKRFRSYTKMMPATYQDVALAEQQGTITGALTEYGFQMSRIRREKVLLVLDKFFTYFILAISAIYFTMSYYFYYTAKRAAKKALKVPLTSGYSVQETREATEKEEDETRLKQDLFGVVTDLTQ